jgi:hypothetical protein
MYYIYYGIFGPSLPIELEYRLLEFLNLIIISVTHLHAYIVPLIIVLILLVLSLKLLPWPSNLCLGLVSWFHTASSSECCDDGWWLPLFTCRCFTKNNLFRVDDHSLVDSEYPLILIFPCYRGRWVQFSLQSRHLLTEGQMVRNNEPVLSQNPFRSKVSTKQRLQGSADRSQSTLTDEYHFQQFC